MDPVTAADAVTELVELRSYRLAPGQAEAFVTHFERHFLASQEVLGMEIVGQFTVPGDDARFVWVRRFRSPTRRGAALARFYGGPVWAEFGPRANELMVDHTDVHLLVPDPSMPDFAPAHVPHAQRPAGGDAPPGGTAGTTVVAATYTLAGTGGLPRGAAEAMGTAAPRAGVTELGRLVSARVPNDFPRLPVHEGVTVAVWLLSDRAGGRAASAAAEAVAAAHDLPVRTTALTPTRRSTLR
ncbi:MAG TPA: NIPSNAP family protein [Acidimicrobiales bacterium]|nr:NIPSNAP family protein [Acidimicrobiales bacterium]